MVSPRFAGWSSDAVSIALTSAMLRSASDMVPLTSWAETNGKEYRASGFSRVAGPSVPGAISVVASESNSDVRAIGKGQLRSTGYSTLHDINLADGHYGLSSTLTGVKLHDHNYGMKCCRAEVLRPPLKRQPAQRLREFGFAFYE